MSKNNIIKNLISIIVDTDTEITELEDKSIVYEIEIDGLYGVINDQKKAIQDLEKEITFLLDEIVELYDKEEDDFLNGIQFCGKYDY